VLRLAPQAARETKSLLNRLVTMLHGDHWSTCTQANVEARMSEEAKEGLQAFLEKRPPSWAPKK